MDLKAIERQIRLLPRDRRVLVEVVSPPSGNYTGYHAALSADEATRLVMTVACSGAPDEVDLEADDNGDLLLSINEVTQ